MMDCGFKMMDCGFKMMDFGSGDWLWAFSGHSGIDM